VGAEVHLCQVEAKSGGGCSGAPTNGEASSASVGRSFVVLEQRRDG
jgi:hypothetical protein